MEDYIDRLYQEIGDLRHKIGKLEAFMVSNNFALASTIQASLINVQHSAMKTYLSCLEQRINWAELQASK